MEILMKKHGNYKTGKYCTPHYCKDCHKEIDWMGRSIRCYHCDIVHKYKTGIWNKKGENNPMSGRQHKKSTRIKQSLSAGGNGIPGENNPYPVEYYRIRPKILKRDNYLCQVCNKSGTDVHHIDYDTENNKKSNLITVCGNHNTKANYNRDYWYAYFIYKMMEER
jgi:hypothetical protein